MKTRNVVEEFTGSTLPANLFDTLHRITKENMRDMYNSSGKEWRWCDDTKITELKDPRMHFMVLFRKVVKYERSGDQMIKNTRELVLGFTAFALYREGNVCYLYLHELQIRNGARGVGYGGTLLGLMEDKGRHMGAQLALLTVLRNNVGAIKFYLKNGFLPDETSPGICFNTEKVFHDIYSKVYDDRAMAHRCNCIVPNFDNITASRKRIFEDSSERNNPLMECFVLNDPETLACAPRYQECGKGFRFKESLLRHKSEAHSQKLPMKCSLKKCGKTMVTRTELENHQFYEHGIKRAVPQPKKNGGSIIKTRSASKTQNSLVSKPPLKKLKVTKTSKSPPTSKSQQNKRRMVLTKLDESRLILVYRIIQEMIRELNSEVVSSISQAVLQPKQPEKKPNPSKGKPKTVPKKVSRKKQKSKPVPVVANSKIVPTPVVPAIVTIPVVVNKAKKAKTSREPSTFIIEPKKPTQLKLKDREGPSLNVGNNIKDFIGPSNKPNNNSERKEVPIDVAVSSTKTIVQVSVGKDPKTEGQESAKTGEKPDDDDFKMALRLQQEINSSGRTRRKRKTYNPDHYFALRANNKMYIKNH